MLVASISSAQTIEAPADKNGSEVNETYSEISEQVKVKTTEEIIAEHFADTPILKRIAACESENRQFNADGTLLRGWMNPLDVGVMQINEKYHLSTATKLGLDIHTLEGNVDYAKYLYSTQGVKPWIHSSSCWDPANTFALR
jgi:hypothetical protein